MVSVSIVTYNHKNYISQCLDSVLMQETTFPFEIILGEDESNDGTREICIEYAKKFPDKIKLFLRSRKDVIYVNGYASGRFNMLENLKSTNGNYIALLEGDDYWTDPLKLQKQVDILEENKTLVACHHWQKIAIQKDEKYLEVDSPKDGYYSQPVSNVKAIFSNKLRLKSRTLMFRNIIDDNFFPDWFTKMAFGDVPLSFLLGKHGDFGFLDEEMAVYRQSGKGVSTAGLSELGHKQFTVQHFKSWIEIWDYADMHYNYKFHKEATATVFEFYNKIIPNLPFTLGAYIGLLKYNLTERQLLFYKTLPHTFWLLNLIFKLFTKKVKKKLKKL